MASAQRFLSPLAPCAAAGVWLIMLCLVGTARAAKYTITQDLVGTVSLVRYTDTFYATPPSTVTMSRTGYSTVTLKPSVTAAPFSTRTSTSSGFGDDSIYGGSGSNGVVVYIYRYFSPGAIPATDMVAPTECADPSDVTTTAFYRMVEYTAPSSCPTPFTLTATVSEYVPSGAEDQVSIESATTSVSTYKYGGVGDSDNRSTTTYTYIAAFLASTSHPTGRALRSQYIYSHYLSPCISPYPYPTQTTTTTTTAFPYPYPTQGTTTTANPHPIPTQTTTTAAPRITSGGSGRDGDGNRPDDLVDHPSCPWSDRGDYPYWGMILVIVLSAVFLLGFVESYLWFRRLMMGRGTLRVGTICWILLCLPLGFLARKIPARSTEDQQTLSARWKEKSFGQCLGHWLRWGLRLRYPVELLGAHPTYKYGDPVADEKEKRVEQGHGSKGKMIQPPVAMENTTNQEQAPILPPPSRFAHGNIRCVSSDSVLTAMSEEAGSKAKDAKGKSVARYGEGMKTKTDPLDPQEGRAPRE
ncbi:hypothetical protein C2857_000191 [Epichloe festucae Fl1]|uniref:Uncharacterized protein n=1 Tax=Epichloe festucae (strain Fl1) TaxID=877507 RepID=A0A7S9KJN8_EPIFF|nr:hypothetical protein C2857_000191 [Epichloe festucae Fl1]